MENNTKNPTSLTRSSDFRHLKNQGQRFKSVNWLTISYLVNSTGKVRFGWTISRQVGNAVYRNRFKRWSREYFRLYLRGRVVVSGMDINVVFRPTSKEFYKNLSRNDLELQFDKFCKKILVKSLAHHE